MTTNAIYRCEEFEDGVSSVYDEIEETVYNELNENADYLEILGDEADQRDHDTDSQPQPPSPTPFTQHEHHDRDYEALKDEKTPNDVYVNMTSEETEECNQSND